MCTVAAAAAAVGDDDDDAASRPIDATDVLCVRQTTGSQLSLQHLRAMLPAYEQQRTVLSAAGTVRCHTHAQHCIVERFRPQNSSYA